MQLKLDSLSFDVETRAEAVPVRDKTAFRMARLTDTASEVPLPGQASLLLDGTLVGFTELPVIVAGAQEDIGFGPINDIRLEWASLDAREGDVGILSRGNARSEAAFASVTDQPCATMMWRTTV